MDARRIPVSLRRDPREVAERHSQANPLTLYCELARGEEVTEALSLYAELHTSRTPQSSPVATAGPVAMAPAGTGPWELDFSAAQMNQTVLPGEDREYWLVVYATGANDLLLTLGTIRLTLAYDNISQTTPAPPEPALILAFRTIAVAGQSSIVADSSADTLTIAAGNGIVLTTNAGTDTLTITAAGGAGSGDVTGPNGATDNAIARFDGTTGKILQNSSATLSDAGGILADTLAISTTPTGAGGTGIFRYDDGEKVPEVGIDGITLKIGVQEYVRVYNAGATTLTKGQVVYISGAQGNRVAVQIADASVEATSAGTLGLVAQSITAGSEGFVQVSGPMYNLNTLGLTAGALLYLSETAGQWTQTEPATPAHGVRIGYVERVHASAGSIFIKVDNGYELGELHNVSDTVTGTIAFLVKNLSTNIWESKNSADTRSAMGLGTLATQSGTFSGTSSGTNTGDVTLAGQSYLTLAGQQITAGQINLASNVTGDLPLANLAQAPDPSVLLGRRSGSSGDYEPITLGTNLSMSGTVLNATGGGGGAPTDADYLVRTANGSLSAERVVTDSTTVTANWATSGQVSFERAALTGDVTASANSNATTIANDAVTYAKIQNVTASRLLGRASGTSGDVEEITLGTNLSFSGSVLNATGGGGISDGDKGDITVSASGATWTIDAQAVTYGKIQNVTTARLLGRASAGTGSAEEITLGNALSFASGSLAVSGFLTGSLDNGALRADGNGGVTLQSSDLVIEDATTATQANLALTNNHAGQTNSSFVITPKGNGAFIVGPPPNAAATGGNARGTNSADLQSTRGAASQVASGTNAFCCGANNTASGTNAAAVNVSNTASGTNSFAHGSSSIASRTGQKAHASGRFATDSDAQVIDLVFRHRTTTNAEVLLALDGGTTYFNIVNGKIYSGILNIHGVKSDGTASAHYIRQVSIKNVGGTTSFAATPATIGTDIAGGTSLNLVANDTNDRLDIGVTGVSAETWRWTAHFEGVETTYGT